MITTGVSITALVISFLSLILSFLLNRDKTPRINSIYIPPLKDSIDLLFDNNNKFCIEIANYNNRDILVYLRDGYISVAQTKCAIKPKYYTLEANAVTKIEIEILVQEPSPKLRESRNKTLIFIKYKGLLFDRTYTIKRRNV